MKYSQLVFLSFLLSCDSSRNVEYSQQFSFYKIEKEFIFMPICRDSTIIFFESSFKNDSIKLFADSKMILNKPITTENHLGLAYSYVSNFSNFKLVKLQFKDYPAQSINSIKYYKYLYISKKVHSDIINLRFSNEMRGYY